MSPVRQLVCLFMVVVLLVPATSLEKRYSNSWAVEVKGGHEVAEQLARKHGFINRGQVPIHDMYTVHVSEGISGCGEIMNVLLGGWHSHQGVSQRAACDLSANPPFFFLEQF